MKGEYEILKLDLSGPPRVLSFWTHVTSELATIHNDFNSEGDDDITVEIPVEEFQALLAQLGRGA